MFVFAVVTAVSAAICIQAPQATRKLSFSRDEVDNVACFFLDRMCGRSISVCGFSDTHIILTAIFAALQYSF